jgi:hypothetical protein
VTGPRQAFEYSLLRVVPRVDRGELINVGVMLYCRPLRFLGVRIDLDTGRLLALDPAADVPSVERALEAVAAVCDQAPEAGSAGQQDMGRRFRWLTAPRSTVVQPGPVHTGLTADPAAELDRLLASLVRLPGGKLPEGRLPEGCLSEAAVGDS